MRRALAVLSLTAAVALPVAPSHAAVAYVIVPTGVVVPTLTSMTFAGGFLYATSYVRGSVFRAPVLAGAALGPATEYATGFDSPLGVIVGPDGTVFVADSHPSGNRTVGRVRALPPGVTTAAGGQIVVDGLPNGRHNTNNLAIHGGRLYVNNGNSTDNGISGGDPELPLSGTVLSVDLAARNVAPVESATLVVAAKGLRNNYDAAFRPGTDELWITTNGPDALAPYGEDLLHKVDVVAEGTIHFGFPECAYKAGPGGPTDPVFIQNPPITTTCSTATHRVPEVTLGLHTSSNGLDFAPTTGGWDGSLFVTQFGSLNGAEGHALVRVPVDAAGTAGAPQLVLPAATPLDAVFGPLGLYVGDFGSGAITLVLPAG